MNDLQATKRALLADIKAEPQGHLYLILADVCDELGEPPSVGEWYRSLGRMFGVTVSATVADVFRFNR